MAAQVTAISKAIESGITRTELAGLLARGGARNALDCAFWDLEAKRAGCRAWELIGRPVQAVTSAYTLSLDNATNMAAEAVEQAAMPLLKLKLDADEPAAKLRAIRAARPDAKLVIDANGGWSPALLDTLADVLVETRVAMLEQPLPRDGDEALARLDYPVPLCADESCQGLDELEAAVERYAMINIKLDKCGGLTEAMRMVAWCRDRDIPMMIGNMLGSSLAMAPAFIVAQACRFVDLDGPLWQRKDRAHAIRYHGPVMQAPEPGLWG
jgi:L-alanine-DL-glutamate epimerase-like enolase superfamily enzyme